VFVDLGQVAFMSSAGIGVLLDMLRKSHSMGGDLRLASAQPGVERTLGLSGMVRVLKTYASAREAVGSFGS
jgi:anti-anti-sigma factor